MDRYSACPFCRVRMVRVVSIVYFAVGLKCAAFAKSKRFRDSMFLSLGSFDWSLDLTSPLFHPPTSKKNPHFLKQQQSSCNPNSILLNGQRYPYKHKNLNSGL